MLSGHLKLPAYVPEIKFITLPAISEHITRRRSRTHISSHESPYIGMGDLTSAMIAT